ncbi:MAG: ABC transporter substrate-binding protein, partial [Candidatus Geothermincolia bacterium]
KSGRLTVGTPTDVLPFEGMQSGKLTGFDVDLGTEIAKRLGLEYRLVPTHWNNLLTDLKAGKLDAVMAAMTITYDRKKTFDFSDPYFDTEQSIAVKKGSPIKTGDDLTGKVVGVLNNSTPQYAAQHLQGLKQIKTYDTVLGVYDALAKGEIDAMIMDLSIAGYRSKTSGETVIIATITTDEQYGIAVKKGNSALVNKLNSALKEIKSDGTYDKIKAKWFGSGS